MDFALTELLPCKQLQELKVGFSDFKQLPMAIEGSESLLSTLKILKTTSCIPQLSRLFDLAIPSLTELHLNCSHFGLPGAGNLSWYELPRLYPNLQVFSLRQPCKNLTLDVLHLIVSQLPRLVSIQLPIEILQSDIDKQLGDDLVEEYEDKSPSISLKFVNFSLEKGESKCTLTSADEGQQ